MSVGSSVKCVLKKKMFITEDLKLHKRSAEKKREYLQLVSNHSKLKNGRHDLKILLSYSVSVQIYFVLT